LHTLQRNIFGVPKFFHMKRCYTNDKQMHNKVVFLKPVLPHSVTRQKVGL
jgi:hypothetical protein